MLTQKAQAVEMPPLEMTETANGYLFAEGAHASGPRVMGRFLGFSFILAGLGLLVAPVEVLWLAKIVLAAAFVVMGGIFAARAGSTPRAEVEVDLEKRMVRKRRRVSATKAHLVAQFPFASITGFDVDGDGRLAALFLETSGERRALITGAAANLEDVARRIGADLLADRGILGAQAA